MEEAVVDADIMHIATVEGKIGRTEILLPLPAVERLAILVVIADNGNKSLISEEPNAWRICRSSLAL